MPKSGLGVVVVEDHLLFTTMLRRVVDRAGARWLGSATTLADGAAMCASTQPQVVVLDLMLPDGVGWNLLPTLARQPVRPSILILSDGLDDCTLLIARRERIPGFISKLDLSPTEMTKGLKAVMANRWYYSDSVRRGMQRVSHSADSWGRMLSRKQMEVLGLLARGKSKTCIAETLGVELPSLATTLRRIRRLVGVASDAELVVWAIDRGFRSWVGAVN